MEREFILSGLTAGEQKVIFGERFDDKR